MPANFFEIENILINSFVNEFTNIDPKKNIAYPNKSLKTTPNSLWIHLHNIPSTTQAVSIGGAGEDENLGIFQIDVNIKEGTLSTIALKQADDIAVFYHAGKSLNNDGGDQEIKITSSSISRKTYIGGYYRVSLSINYYSLTSRF